VTEICLNLKVSNHDEHRQQEGFARQLAEYIGENQRVLEAVGSWTELFKLLAEVTREGIWTIYFEELQWLANYETKLVSELKYVWDNFFRRNPQSILVLCGSSPSFMKNGVIKSRSLYARSMHEVFLQPFNIVETKEFLGLDREDISVLDCYLAVGGIPEYLKYFKAEKRTTVATLGLANRNGLFSFMFAENKGVEPRR
jgi:hypothetical protein